MSRSVYPCAEACDPRLSEEQVLQRQKLEAIGQLAAGIAHEINTPVQYVGDNLRFLADATEATRDVFAGIERLRRQLAEGVDAAAVRAEVERLGEAADRADFSYLAAEVPKAISQSVEGVQRVSRIVRAMKEFAHPHGDGRAPIDLNETIETTLVVAHNQLKYVAETRLELDPAMPQVWCLPDAIKQVLLTLLTNAAHAIADTVSARQGLGCITVSTRPAEDWVEVWVADTGTGIPEGIAPHVFEPFFTTKEVGRGTGQGLALAYATIVNQHGGRIWFETEVGRGTTFFVRLPLRRPRAE